MQNDSSPGLRRRIIWSVAALIAIVVLALGVYNAVALPGCRSCHDREDFRAATALTSHADIDCRSCHVPAGFADRAAYSLRQTFHMFVPLTGGAERDAAAVPDSRCLTCHADVTGEVTTSGGLRIAHATCADASKCSDCHSATAHGTATSWVRVYDMDTCLSCHVSTEQTNCDLCHESRLASGRIKSGTFAIVHGSEWRSTHGLGNTATCGVCHQESDCVECHGPGLPHGAHFIEVHSEYSAKKGAKCSGCHDTSFCDGCHGTPMPHAASFTQTHAEDAAARPALCERCHAEPDCKTCHEKHVHPGGAIGGNGTQGGGS